MSIDNDWRISKPLLKWSPETALAAEWMGYEVLATRGTQPAHDGWGCHLLQALTGRGMIYATLEWTYGSCEKCDDISSVVFDRENGEECFEVFGDLIVIYDSLEDAQYAYDHAGEYFPEQGYCFRIGFDKFAFPVIRRVFPGLIASEIVSVQPMTTPAGMAFFMDYQYQQRPEVPSGPFVSGSGSHTMTTSRLPNCHDVGEVATHRDCTDDRCAVRDLIHKLTEEMNS